MEPEETLQIINPVLNQSKKRTINNNENSKQQSDHRKNEYHEGVPMEPEAALQIINFALNQSSKRTNNQNIMNSMQKMRKRIRNTWQGQIRSALSSGNIFASEDAVHMGTKRYAGLPDRF